MDYISKIKVNNTDYIIKDATSRAALGTLLDNNAVPTALANKIGYADYRTVTESNATKHYIYFYKDDSDAPTNASTIPSTYLCKIDAAPFVKDGMISSVAISNGNLVITWNSDSTGVTTPTTIPLTDIFNPANYYDKTTLDGMLANKAEKSELSITDVTGQSDKKNVLLKSGVSLEFLIAHLDISGKADKSSTVTNVSYDSTSKKILKTINGSTTDVVTLATVATSGSYNDLSDKPTIPAAPGTLNTTLTTAQTTSSSEALSGAVKLHKIAKTGTYGDLIGTPTNVSSFTNDSGYQTAALVTSAISSAVNGSYAASTETLSFTLPSFTVS